jgi:hypothetical protein
MIYKRDSNGRFAEGNRGGLGRPKRATERHYLDAMQVACSPEEWREIVGKAVTDAKNGDAKARDWLSNYLLGKPEGLAPTLRKMAIEDAAGIEDGISKNDIFFTGLDNMA